MPIQNLHLRSNVQGKEPVAGSATGQLPVGSIAINYNKDEPFLSIQDSNGDIRRIAGIKVGATAPATPSGGEAWLDTTISTKPVFKVFDGTAWQGAGSGVSTGGTAPAAPLEGDLWVDTSVSGSPVLNVYNGTAWSVVTPDATTTSKGVVQLADAAAVTAGTAGLVVDAAQLKAVSDAVAAEDLWDRAGTTLSPANAGDSMVFDTNGLVYDAANKRLAIGTATPTSILDCSSSTDLAINVTKTGVASLRLGYDTNGAYVEGVGNSQHLGFRAGNSERARLDSAGRLLVGTSSAHTLGSGQYSKLTVQGYVGGGGTTGAGYFSISRGQPATTPLSSVSHIGGLYFTDSAGATFSSIETFGDGDTGSDDYPGRLVFGTTADGAAGPTPRMTIDSSGRLLVGTPSPFRADSFLQVKGGNSSAVGSLGLATTTDAPVDGSGLGFVTFANGAGARGATISCSADGSTHTGSSSPGHLAFFTTPTGSTSPTERMRISNNGQSSHFGAATVIISASATGAGTGEYLFVGQHSATGIGNGTDSVRITTNGNITNTNNSYGAISDAKLKENIVDASSQWDDLKALQVRNYNFKEGQTHTQIGLVAQEAELVSPGLVSESPDRDDEGNDLGTVTKSVNYSVLYMKAVKALQEAMERIEVLEQRLSDAGIA